MPASLSALPAVSSSTAAQADPASQTQQTSTAPKGCGINYASACLPALRVCHSSGRAQKQYNSTCAYFKSDKFQSSIQFALGASTFPLQYGGFKRLAACCGSATSTALQPNHKAANGLDLSLSTFSSANLGAPHGQFCVGNTSSTAKDFSHAPTAAKTF